MKALFADSLRLENRNKEQIIKQNTAKLQEQNEARVGKSSTE